MKESLWNEVIYIVQQQNREMLQFYLVLMWDDGGDLSASEGEVLSREVVDRPGSWVKGVVEGVLPAVAPVPAL